MEKLIYFLFELVGIRRKMKSWLVITCFIALLLLAYLVPYTILRSPELTWFTYLFWCIDALAAIALMFYVMRSWRV